MVAGACAPHCRELGGSDRQGIWSVPGQRLSWQHPRRFPASGDCMMKKSPRSIPDFSRKKKAVPAAGQPEAKPEATPHAPTRPVKPPVTLTKSGRRGG